MPRRACRTPCSARGRRRRERRGRAGSGAGRPLEEGLCVDIRREDRGRLDAERPDETARLRRDGAHRIRSAHRVRRERVVQRVQEPAQRRAVEARRLVPVSLHVEDDLRPRARPRARGEERHELVDALHECGLGLEGAQLARDAERQQQIEERAVEHPRPSGADEVKPIVAGRPPGGRSCEHAVVDDAGERVPLALLRALERQAEALARDEEHARAHAPASSRTRSAQWSTECPAATRSRSSRPAPPE